MKLRVYFNDHGDPGVAWSYDNGPGTEERQCRRVAFLGVEAIATFYDEEAEPCAWIEMNDVRYTLKNEILMVTSA